MQEHSLQWRAGGCVRKCKRQLEDNNLSWTCPCSGAESLQLLIIFRQADECDIVASGMFPTLQ